MQQMTITTRQQTILEFFRDQLDAGHPDVTAAQVMNALPEAVERTTLFRDIDALSKLHILIAQGSTKSRTYNLNQLSMEYLEWDLTRPPELRREVRYQPSVLEQYIPNQTQWLQQADLDALHALSPSDQIDSDDNYRKVLNALLIDLTYASSRLENVRISWLDTKSLIEFGEQPKGLSAQGLAIVMNHKEAVKFMCEQRTNIDLQKRDIFDIHKLLTLNLLGNPSDGGRLRQGIIFFDGSRYKPIDNTFVLEDQFRLFCEKAALIKDPFEKSLFTMLFIPYLQPFQDGNKRTSRLCMNIPLLKSGLAPFSFTTVPKRDYMFALLAFYERNRIEPMVKVFVDAYAQSTPKYVQTMKYLNDGGVLSTLAHRPRERG